MTLEVVRRVRGNVHGTIDITAIEDAAIAHPIFQRMRRIRQLAFLSFVFPGATHTRFEHSLGVLSLVGSAWRKLAENQRRLAQNADRYDDFAGREQSGDGIVHGLLAPTFDIWSEVFESDYTLQAVRLAGMLHDLGHPPFSHSGERFLPSWQEVIDNNADLSPYLSSYLQAQYDSLREKGVDVRQQSVRHEIFTLLMIDQLLQDTAAKDSQSGGPTIEPRDVLAIIAPEIGPAPQSPLARFGIFRLCHELISGEFDLDRMDYLLRDSRECGVVYGIFDASRILDSLSIYFDPRDEGLHLAITQSGLAAFDDYLRARFSMYLQLYFHKTSVAAEAMMQHLCSLLGGWRLPAELSAYLEVDEYNIQQKLQEAAGDALNDRTLRSEFERTLQDLLLHRRLWKRVFEIVSNPNRLGHEETDAIQRAHQHVVDLGVPFQQVSSTGSLTRFRPRNPEEVSRNYLRLIKKDEHQFPRIVPIEDYSSVIDSADRTRITRIYVENREGDASPSARDIKAALAKG